MLHVMWEGCTHGAHHEAMKTWKRRIEDLRVIPLVAQVLPNEWPQECDRCGTPVAGPKVLYRIQYIRVYDTFSGDPEPGDLYQAPWNHDWCAWSNCDGTHWVLVLPDAAPFHLTGRMIDCDQPEDREHRCLKLMGEPPHLYVVSGGKCSAGIGGALGYKGWRGYVFDGDLTVS